MNKHKNKQKLTTYIHGTQPYLRIWYSFSYSWNATTIMVQKS